MTDKRKIKVACDVDGVLADFIGEYERQEIGTNPLINTDNFWKNPPYEFWASLARISDPNDFWDALDGCEVTFLTNCPNPKARSWWLIKHGFWRSGCALWCNPAGQPKTEPLRRLAPDLFIDDHDKQIKNGEKAGVPNLWLFDTENPGISWLNIKELIQDLRAGW